MKKIFLYFCLLLFLFPIFAGNYLYNPGDRFVTKEYEEQSFTTDKENFYDGYIRSYKILAIIPYQDGYLILMNDNYMYFFKENDIIYDESGNEYKLHLKPNLITLELVSPV